MKAEDKQFSSGEEGIPKKRGNCLGGEGARKELRGESQNEDRFDEGGLHAKEQRESRS